MHCINILPYICGIQKQRDMKTLTTEQREFLKADIVKAAKENNIPVLKQISLMQSKCLERSQEQALEILCDIKTDFINL